MSLYSASLGGLEATSNLPCQKNGENIQLVTGTDLEMLDRGSTTHLTGSQDVTRGLPKGLIGCINMGWLREGPNTLASVSSLLPCEMKMEGIPQI